MPSPWFFITVLGSDFSKETWGSLSFTLHVCCVACVTFGGILDIRGRLLNIHGPCIANDVLQIFWILTGAVEDTAVTWHIPPLLLYQVAVMHRWRNAVRALVIVFLQGVLDSTIDSSSHVRWEWGIAIVSTLGLYIFGLESAKHPAGLWFHLADLLTYVLWESCILADGDT